MVGGVAEVEVGFQPIHGRQQLLAGPADAPLCRPAIEVIQFRSIGDHPVDRRAAAQAAATIVDTRRLDIGTPCQQLRPMERRELLGAKDPTRIGAAHLGGCVGGAVIRTGLEQQHRRAGIFAQPRRQHRSRRPRADDDIVVRLFHGLPPSAVRLVDRRSRARPENVVNR